jgi:hypothetical protein
MQAVCRIRDILVRIRILGSVPLTDGPDLDPAPDPSLFLSFFAFPDPEGPKNYGSGSATLNASRIWERQEREDIKM